MRVLSDYTQAAMRRRLVTAALFTVAVMPYGEPCGVICASWSAQTGMANTQIIDALFVDPNMQGMGIGRSLIDALYEVSAPLKVQCISVASSLTAVGFYALVGFSRDRRGTSHTGVETVMMDRKLI
jgi:GNAT superfamily N-acetyltransferase